MEERSGGVGDNKELTRDYQNMLEFTQKLSGRSDESLLDGETIASRDWVCMCVEGFLPR